MKLHLPIVLLAMTVMPSIVMADTSFTVNSSIENWVDSFNTVQPEAREDGKTYIALEKVDKSLFLDASKHIALLQQAEGKKDLELGDGDKVGYFDAEGNFNENEHVLTQVLYVDGNINMNGKAHIHIVGEPGQVYKSGLIAKEVTVNAGELEASAAKFESLTINGGTVKLNKNGGGGSMYGAGVTAVDHPGLNGAYNHDNLFLFSNVSIQNKLEVNGGHVEIGRIVTSETYRDRNSDGWYYWRSSIAGEITQSNGTLQLWGKTYIASDKITQTGGTMHIAYDNTAKDYLRFEKSAVVIDQSNGLLEMDGIIIRGNAKNENMQLNIKQTGAGTVNLNASSLFTTKDAQSASNISQSGNGTISIKGDYSSATFNVTQTGEGGLITVTKNGQLKSDVLSLNTASDLNISGTLILNDEANINVTFSDLDAAIHLTEINDLVLAGTANFELTLTDVALGCMLTDDSLNTLITEGETTFTVDLIDGLGSIDDAAAENILSSLTLSENAHNVYLNNGESLQFATNIETLADVITMGELPDAVSVSGTSLQIVDGKLQAVVTVSTTLIPEPATATLSLLALAALAARRRRQ